MYIIDYMTGVENDTAGTLDEAKQIADKGASYTQQPIVIRDGDGNEITRRPWWGAYPDNKEDEGENCIYFGDYGYYSDWIEE